MPGKTPSADLGDMSSPQYSGPMCKAKHQGGKRCKSCGTVASSMKANGNRRQGRIARKKVADALKEQGLPKTAALVMESPPSMLPELMSALGIDPEILGDTPMPSTHVTPPSAELLIAFAASEKAELEADAEPQISPERQALADALAELEEVQNTTVDYDAKDEELRKAINRTQAKVRRLKKAADEELLAHGPSDKYLLMQQDVQLAEAEVKNLKLERESVKIQKQLGGNAELKAAQDKVTAAQFQVNKAELEGEELDKYYASMAEDDVDMIVTTLSAQHHEEAQAALSAGGKLGISPTMRDTSVYVPGTVPMYNGTDVVQVEGRFLDGGTAIVRNGYSDFVVLQKNGDAYYPVTTAHGKADALSKANRIPIFTEIGEAPEGSDSFTIQAAAVQRNLMMDVATKTAEGNLFHDVSGKYIDNKLETAATEMSYSVVDGDIRPDVHDGARRYRQLVRERTADTAGVAARDAAFATGASIKEADAAYKAAYRKAMGTPTVGGGTIPHFDHEIPPKSIGADVHKKLSHSGIRTFGKETVNDYSIISERKGDLNAWGFHSHGGQLSISEIAKLTTANSAFVKKELNANERNALSTYTGGSYQAINAAISGRDPKPASHVKSTVEHLTTAFEKFAAKNPNAKAMTVMRGTRVPSKWTGTTEQYLDAVFTPGEKVQIGKVTSCTTNPGTASGFTGHPPYMMVVRTREGLPVKSISHHKGEDEVVIPPGADLRCVRIDHHGIGGRPTVYLVAEDLVAEAQDGVNQKVAA